MKIFCDCGEEMYLNLWEPDQDEVYLEFYCDKCGATFSGKLKPSELIEPESLGDILRRALKQAKDGEDE